MVNTWMFTTTVIVHLLCFAADSGVNFSEATRISVALCHNVVAILLKQALKNKKNYYQLMSQFMAEYLIGPLDTYFFWGEL